MLRRLIRAAGLGLALAILVTAPAEAQRLHQYAHASLEAPQLLARGGAGVALSRAETALYYNPAQLARLNLVRPRVEILSVQGAASTNLFGNLRFLLDDVSNAVDAGFTTPLSDEDRALFSEAIDRGRRPTVGQAAVSVPTVLLSAGPVSVGTGLFATNTTWYRFDDIGGGIPMLDLFSQVDIGFAAAAATTIPDTPLAAGLTSRIVRRYVTSKKKDLLSMDPDAEQLYVLSGTTAAIDFGLHGANLIPSLPGQFDLGLAVYDVLGGGFNYDLHRSIALTGNGEVNGRELEQIMTEFEGRDGRPSIRAGAAYHLPRALGPFAEAAVALDWYSASTSESRQPALAGLRLGGEAVVADRVAVRAGVGQGYPSVGIGLHLPGVRIDYSLFGIEDGRRPGQLQRYNHVLQLRIGLF